MSKRTLSESSTASSGDDEQHSANGAPYFKIPRRETPVLTNAVFRPKNPAYYSDQVYHGSGNLSQTGDATSQARNYERRESQASTTSSNTSRSSASDTEEDYIDGQKVPTVRTVV